MQIKTTMRYHLMLVKMTAIQKSTNSKWWRACGEKGTLLHCWWECKLAHSVIFEIASEYCILDSFVDYDGYSISPKGFLPKVVDIMVTELNLPIPVHFSSLIPRITMFTLTISLGHFQFTLSHGPNIPGSYAIFFLELQTLLPSPVTSAPRLCFGFGSASSFFLGYFSTLL